MKVGAVKSRHEIPQAANRRDRAEPHGLRAADWVVGAELLFGLSIARLRPKSTNRFLARPPDRKPKMDTNRVFPSAYRFCASSILAACATAPYAWWITVGSVVLGLQPPRP